MRIRLALLLVLAIFGCSRPMKPTRPPEPPVRESVPETSVGLSPGNLLDVPEPMQVSPNSSEPGERPVLPRPYPGAPPLIPHEIDSLLPITADDNTCLVCHEIDEKVEGGPTPIPKSHYVDQRNAPERSGNRVVGARNSCTLCHVPQTDALPLVRNRF